MACGYIGLSCNALQDWRTFAADLGMQVSSDSTETRLLLRVDERAFRVSVEPGEDAVRYVGWEVASEQGLDRLAVRLSAAGIECTESPDLAIERGVDRLIRTADPGGNVLEFFVGARIAREPFVSPTGAVFVTSHRGRGDLGFGHVVVTFDDYEAARHFYIDLLGFDVSDICLLEQPWLFTRVNPRHHSLAFGHVPGQSAYHHFMLEVTDEDTVGRALDRFMDAGAPLTAGLGRHTNDLMLSFYVRSPSGIEVEYGCQGRLIDDNAWSTATYESDRIWGHRRLGG
ncbi:VOC family protein [Longivirga aurantiaca]|uniref:VOC family protein n=1 Tax=Longivirga aurantiaca TaxID=1837743 RepID=A0ABW1SVA3_9ACTN